MADHVILLHGIWMRAFTLVVLRQKLERAGYEVSLFDYASVLRNPQASIAALLDQVRARGKQQVHFVGHSLGGLIALQALRERREWPHGRVVCLGTPLRGSAVARQLARLPGGGLLIGRSLDILRDGLDRWDGTNPVGVIAGRLPIGLGFVTGALSTPHDGTVSVAETELPGLTDHCVIAASHLGLLFSDEAAEQSIAFLRTARFAR